jgi:hypothetical protein
MHAVFRKFVEYKEQRKFASATRLLQTTQRKCPAHVPQITVNKRGQTSPNRLENARKQRACANPALLFTGAGCVAHADRVARVAFQTASRARSCGCEKSTGVPFGMMPSGLRRAIDQ